MKDGIYRVTLTIDGRPIVAEAQVRNGVFQGLGEFAGLVGVFTTPQQGEARAAEPAARPPALARDLQVVRDEVDTIREKARSAALRATTAG